MKEFTGWIRWVWTRMARWQKLYIVGAAFMGAGVVAHPDVRPYLLAVPAALLFGWLTHMAWVMFKDSWNKYKVYRNEMFNNIKTSDKDAS
jgi:hypothetical protein